MLTEGILFFLGYCPYSCIILMEHIFTEAALDATEQFLDIYKKLERAIKDAYNLRSDESAIYYLATRRKEFRQYSHTLQTAREVRNLLQHNEKIQGAYPVVVSKELLVALIACYDRISKPVTAWEICVPSSKVFSASWDDCVYDVFRQMISLGFRHCPILEDGRVVGIFGSDTVGNLFADSSIVDLSSLTFVDLKKEQLVSLDAHHSEYFGFIPQSMRFERIDDIFDKIYAEGKHYAMLFVTASGASEERIQGIITSYDMVGYREA